MRGGGYGGRATSFSRRVELRDPSQVGEARREINSLGAASGLDETIRGKAALIATECANNVLKHGGGGEVVVRPLVREGCQGLEIIAIDSGPGMADINKCLDDGYSTIGTAGSGFGSIRRNASVFDAWTQPQKGTIVVAQVWDRLPVERFEIGAIALPKRGEVACGDSWAVAMHANSQLVMIADGLGHGPVAAEASSAAVDVFLEQVSHAPAFIIEVAHGALRSSRGAAMAVAKIDPTRVDFCGIGNISASIWSGASSRSLVSHNGTVGHELRKIQPFEYPWAAGDLLVLHSDGVSTNWRLSSYPGLTFRHPSVVAGMLYRDYCRGRDDATVLVIRESVPR